MTICKFPTANINNVNIIANYIQMMGNKDAKLATEAHLQLLTES